MGKQIAVLMTDLFEESEFTEPKKALTEAGHNVVVIEKEKGKMLKGKNGNEPISVDASIDDVKPSEFDALLIPGGFSPDILRADDRFVKFAKEFMESQKPVFTICHGPQLLITAETLKGRDVTGYKSIHIDIKNAGATLHDEEVVVCQNQLVTSRTPADLDAFNREMLKLL
ncbi:type 1 glutamine amidotransferase domain-containing protein [Pueribacillus sp. YX66]|uniref:type 1 glutamine amidotransferase domain-containing protein n=1 Tax=Pueribacillus sp. YX66 TaxID=3229242 RepID=UPI00358D518A